MLTLERLTLCITAIILISILSPLATAQIINEFSVSPGDERGV
jgi:hypothetical protein